MESCRSTRPKLLLCLAAAVVLLLLLLPLQPASAVPTSRSMHLRSQQQRPPSLKLSPLQDQMMAAAAKIDQGRAAARMAVEVNDYPGSGPNNRHDPPKGPGRG